MGDGDAARWVTLGRLDARGARIPAAHVAVPIAAALAAAVTGLAYWPGLMTWDPVRQYGEALSGAITDWHPPVMQWVWQRLLPIAHGPAPMLVLQLGLFWAGLAILALGVRQDGRPRLGWALLACGLWPPAMALMGAILKDCLMTGAILVAAGMLATQRERGRGWQRAAGLLFLLFAATLRFNAFAACLPLAVALLPAAWRCTVPRLALTSVAVAGILLAAMPLANRAIGAEPSAVELSLVIFDLGGITEHAGVNVFPDDIEVGDPVAVNHRCYRPAKWDSYSDWVDPECPLGFTAWSDNVDPAEVHPYLFWARAVLAHPIAYAEHRLTHFAINTRILPLTDAVERPVPHEDAPNPWGFRVAPNPLLRSLDAAALATAHTPLGWPIVAIALALGALLAGAGLPNARLSVPIAASSALYGLGYLVLSVASELRYHLWTQLGALIAVVIVAGDIAGGATIARWRLGVGAGLIGSVIVLSTSLRLAA
ncbi:hypothetical protein [Sphingomonas sp.]|uniref:hypothetical protein n=1 Tax=Sphingomonas sp. TaxID=28214 RepID=UPI003CC53BDB